MPRNYNCQKGIKFGHQASRWEDIAVSTRKQKKADKKRRERQEKAKKARLQGPPIEVILNPAGVKMSEVLMEFANPDEETLGDAKRLETLLAVASVAWNAALLPPEERDKFLLDAQKRAPAGTGESFLAVILPLIRRKEALFPTIRRGIIDFTVTMHPTGPYVQVISSLSGH